MYRVFCCVVFRFLSLCAGGVRSRLGFPVFDQEVKGCNTYIRALVSSPSRVKHWAVVFFDPLMGL